jgi:molybdopterin molybdotransferase
MAAVLELSFRDARQAVLDRVRAAPAAETVALLEAAGRVLAAPVCADRDLPPAPRALRDGFAVRTAETPGELRIVGEIRAGEAATIELHAGEAIEIMTGAIVPAGADAVVMIEHVTRTGDSVSVPAAKTGQYIDPRGSHARRGDILIEAGQRLGPAEIALAASVGADIHVHNRPIVAILTTGDELVGVDATPAPHQVRDSNAIALAAQVAAAGGLPRILPRVGDSLDTTTAQIRAGLQADLLLISGGVSAGKFDFVEAALAQLGAEFFFTHVRMQPGRPCVFGHAAGSFFFGLPGNPVSTLVCFETLARAAVELLAGEARPTLQISRAKLKQPFAQQPGLRRFLPAVLDEDGELEPLKWAGSGDLATLARANCWLVTEPDRATWAAGEWMEVLAR